MTDADPMAAAPPMAVIALPLRGWRCLVLSSVNPIYRQRVTPPTGLLDKNKLEVLEWKVS
jgi:hypothetical protein